MLNRLTSRPDEFSNMAGPLFAATREIATATSAESIIDTLRKYVLGDEADRVSLIQIGFGPSGEAVTEAVTVWDRNGIATKADLPEALRQRILREPLIVSHASALDSGAAEIKEYALDILHAESFAVFPLLAQTRTVGYLVLASSKPVPFHDNEVEIFQTMAVQIAVLLENLSLLNAVSRKTEHLFLVNDLARSMADVHDLETLGELVSVTLAKALPVSHVSIALHEAGQPKARTTTFKGRPLPGEIVLEGTRIENALTANIVIQNASVSQLPDAGLWRDTGINALIVAPMSSGDRPMGTLNVGAADATAFRGDDAALVQQIAAQLAAALESMRLFERLQLSLEETTALYSTSLAMNAAQSLDEAYETALNEIAELAGADEVGLFLAGPDPRGDVRYVEMVAQWLQGELKTADLMERHLVNEAPVLSQFPLSRANLMFNDLETDRRLDADLRSRYTSRGVNALMMIPVSTGMIWLGALLIEARSGQTFTSDQARLCRNVADQAALIIDSQLLLKRAHDAAEREHALRDMAAALSTTLDRDTVLKTVLEQIRRAVPHDTANILIIEGNAARPMALHGYAERGIDEQSVLNLKLPLDQAVHLRSTIETRQASIIDDTRSHPTWVRTPETNWIRSNISVPINLEDQVLGFISLDSATPASFDSETASFLQAFADQAAIAIQNADLYYKSNRRAEAAAHMARFSEEIQRAPSVDNVMEKAVSTLNEMLGDYDIKLRLAPHMEVTTHRLLDENPEEGVDKPETA